MPIPLRLLVVEDREDDVLLVTDELQRGGFDVSWERVETAEAMAEALERGPWDLIISDFRMPTFSGPEALALCHARGSETPFILVSGTIGEEQAVASIKAGAHDFFLKDRLARLCPAVARELREAGNRRAWRRAEEEREESRSALARSVQALRKSEQRFAGLIESAPDPMVISNARGEIVLVNAQTERLFGYPREELLGKPVEMLVPERFRGDGDRNPCGVRKDGTEFPVEVALSPLEMEEGRLVARAIRDVSERKQMETTLRENVTALEQAEADLLRARRFLQSIVDTIPSIVFIYDLEERRIVYSNREITTILGYTPDQVQGMGSSLIEQLLHSDDLPRMLEQHQGYLTAEDNKSYEIEYRAKHASGAWRWLRSRDVVFARDHDGRVRQILGVAADVTDQRRTQDLLQQAQKVEAIGRLAGGVAHDFNNILGVITGYGELAQKQLEPGHPVRARLDQMLKAAERAAGLTRQLLAFSRKQVMQPKRLDLNSVVADAHEMLGRLIGEDIDVFVQPGPGLGTVMADPGQIDQVVMNLAVNARDAMPKGGSLTLETANVDLDEDYCAAHPLARPGRYVMLAVSDTGVGMDEETQHRVFEPFFTTKPAGEGTCLGLATLHGIVKQSGGYIWVYSEPGRGTTFKVYLPRVEEPSEAVPEGDAPAEAPRGLETILLVEDTAALQEVIRETLEERGYKVLLASNGEEALALGREREGPIDLLLTDVVMPKLGGADLAKLLVALRPRMRVLYMSGYTNGAISQQGLLGEGVMLLEKPFTGDKLARAVRKALDRPAAT